MFEELYQQPVTCDRHRTSPNLGERLRYLNALRDQGYSKKSLLEAANKLLVVVRELGADLRPGVTPVQIRAAAQRFKQGRRRYASRPKPKRSGHYFTFYATNWLRFLGWLKEPAPVVPPYAPLLEEFCTWMREDRNLAEETIKTKRFHIGTLLRWHDSRGGKAQKLGLAEVDAFLAEGETKHWSRRTMPRLPTRFASSFGMALREAGGALRLRKRSKGPWSTAKNRCRRAPHGTMSADCLRV